MRPKPVLPKLVPKPKATASAKTRKGTARTPYKFLKTKFQRTNTSPLKANSGFGQQGNGYQVISRVHFIRAGVELGYGPRKSWNSAFVLSGNSARELASHLLLRLQSIMSCLDQSKDDCWKTRKFYERIEASEKVSISFTIGSIFSFHAARMWLRAAGDDLELFLHTGLYTKGIVSSSVRVSYSSSTEQRPDFLVYSQKGHWSLFESKGGTSAKKWGQLYKGLRQLQGSPKLGWQSAPTTAAPQACVCTYTEVDTDKPLKTIAIDPPEDDFPNFPDADEPIPEAPDLVLEKGVVQLMVILQAIDQFRALAADAAHSGFEEVDPEEPWITLETRRFEGLMVGIPQKLLHAEPRIRATLACYLIVQELVEDRNFRIPSRLDYLERPLADAVFDCLEELEGGEVTKAYANLIAGSLNSIPDGITRVAIGDDSIFRDCAHSLGIEVTANRLMDYIRKMPLPDERFLKPDSERVITTGGLLLAEVPSQRRQPEQS